MYMWKEFGRMSKYVNDPINDRDKIQKEILCDNLLYT